MNTAEKTKVVVERLQQLVRTNQKVALCLREGAVMQSKDLIELLDLNIEAWQVVIPVLEIEL